MIDPLDEKPLWGFQLTRGTPRDALLLDLQGPGGNRPRRHRRVLVCGEMLAASRRTLRNRGAALTVISNALSAIEILARESFDIVVVEAEGVSGGLDLVKALKLGQSAFDISSELLEKAKLKHRVTPVLVLPLPGGTEFAIIVKPPEIAVLEDTAKVSLENAILRLDVRKLLFGRGAVA